VTESFRKNLIARGVPARKVHTVLNGADVDFWKPLEPSGRGDDSRDPAGRFVVLYAGAHGISQALPAILEAAQILRDVPRIQFLFVGDGAVKEDLIRSAEEKRLANVRFLDPADKAALRRWYSEADVCLVPLRNIPLFDSFIPSKMFEIMAMARPIVAGVRGEAADILKASGGALIVEPENSQAVADAIRFLHDHPGARAGMGRRAREFVTARYARRSLASRYLEILREIISAHKVRP